MALPPVGASHPLSPYMDRLSGRRDPWALAFRTPRLDRPESAYGGAHRGNAGLPGIVLESFRIATVKAAAR